MNRKIFGNPLGQVFFILAVIAGLAGAGFLTFNVFFLVGAENFGSLFEGDKLMPSIFALCAIAICIPFLLVALISGIVGLATKRRGIGVFSVLFVLLGLLLQGVAYIIGFGDIANFFSKFNWGNFFFQGDLLVVLSYLVLAVAFVLALIALICAAARKRAGAIVFGVIALIFYLGGAFLYIWPLFFTNPANGEVFVLFEALIDGGVSEIGALGVIFLIVRGAFPAIVGLMIFFLCAAKVEAKAKKAVAAETRVTKVEEKKSDSKKEKDEGSKVDVYERKDRIIIEIR